MRNTAYKGRTGKGMAVEVAVEGARIRSVSPLKHTPGDKDLPYILPVLVDLQHNGALGRYYGEIPDADTEKLREIAAFLRRHGVGRCLLTLVTQERSGIERTAAFLGKTLDTDRELSRLFFGVFHEGIFISPKDGWRGAHMREWVAPPEWERLRRVDELLGGRISLINVAPEEPGGLDFIEHAIAAGKIISLGHCCPATEIIAEAIARGASMVTHFGNGAASQIHRFKNPFWDFLDRDELSLGLVCDGFHLPASLVRIALKCKGREKFLPVSDASGYSGMPPGEYNTAGGRRIAITPAGRIHMASTPEVLSGAWFQQDRCVEFLVREAGFTFLEAWEQCSRIPARAIGLQLPALAEGEEASFILARWQDGVRIEQAVYAGVPEAMSA